MDDHAKFFRQRLTDLRIKKGVSEYQMSSDLGMSKGYIQQISSGHALPRMGMFFEICDYLSISPVEFFTQENRDPGMTKALVDAARSLSVEKMEALTTMAELLQ